MKAIVVVESPTKARTIGKYLGEYYHVVASYGHIRDLPPRSGSVKPSEHFSLDWVIVERAEQHIQTIIEALHDASHLYLATDPDREGEAIAWHVYIELIQRGISRVIDVKRVTFHEITYNAIQIAFQSARNLNSELVEAYFARRALDYLVGFTISPILWRKLPGSRSAGRVQSAALRLVCEREIEIERFVARKYWTVSAKFATKESDLFTATLTHLDGIKLSRFSFSNVEAAISAQALVEKSHFVISTLKKRKTKRRPHPPFTTSTLQQEASRKLHFTASHTMQVAQQLYEGIDINGESTGLITYMRTDGVQIASEAVQSIRNLIFYMFGNKYQPITPYRYKTKIKNAQEAHEAIRPTDINRDPQTIATFLDSDQLRLYELVWKRTVASQMASARFNHVTVNIQSENQRIIMRATESEIAFPGFLILYRVASSVTSPSTTFVKKNKENNSLLSLPKTYISSLVHCGSVYTRQHSTQSPPHYSEASLIKKLEELGIGRPSTYTSILSILRNRNYARLERRCFIPEDRGRIVTVFLSSYFSRYIQYTFTAELEEQLDDIAVGRIYWKTILRQFWRSFVRYVDNTRELRVKEVLDVLDRILESYFFPVNADNKDNPRRCPTCTDGRLSLKLGKFGAFIGCSRYPLCRYTRQLTALTITDNDIDDVQELGLYPGSSEVVSLRQGPYGSYVQLDSFPNLQDSSAISSLLKRVPIRGINPSDITLAKAIQLLRLPQKIGLHPRSGQPIILGLSRFGGYLQHAGIFKTLPESTSILRFNIRKALNILSDVAREKILGIHPVDGLPVYLKIGYHSPYIEHGITRIHVPNNNSTERLSLESAIALLFPVEKRKKKLQKKCSEIIS